MNGVIVIEGLKQGVVLLGIDSIEGRFHVIDISSFDELPFLVDMVY